MDQKGGKHSELATFKLNVGGQIFETTQGTIHILAAESEYFKRVLNEIQESSSNSVLFIDRDPALFSIILNIARKNQFDNICLPPNVSLYHLQEEANFFSIPKLWLHVYVHAQQDKQGSSSSPRHGSEKSSSSSSLSMSIGSRNLKRVKDLEKHSKKETEKKSKNETESCKKITKKTSKVSIRKEEDDKGDLK